MIKQGKHKPSHIPHKSITSTNSITRPSSSFTGKCKKRWSCISFEASHIVRSVWHTIWIRSHDTEYSSCYIMRYPLFPTTLRKFGTFSLNICSINAFMATNCAAFELFPPAAYFIAAAIISAIATPDSPLSCTFSNTVIASYKHLAISNKPTTAPSLSSTGKWRKRCPLSVPRHPMPSPPNAHTWDCESSQNLPWSQLGLWIEIPHDAWDHCL